MRRFLRLRRRLALMTPGLAALMFLRLAVASAASPEDVLVLGPPVSLDIA